MTHEAPPPGANARWRGRDARSAAQVLAIERELQAQGASVKTGAWVEAFSRHMQ